MVLVCSKLHVYRLGTSNQSYEVERYTSQAPAFVIAKGDLSNNQTQGLG